MSTPAAHVRPIRPSDRNAWQPLWDGYNAFYGREGANALDARITAQTWARFFDRNEPVHALVAEADGRIVGMAHFLFHRSTSRLSDVCYLQDLFTDPGCRGRGIGRAWGIVIVYFGFALVLVGVLWLVIPTVVGQVSLFFRDLPGMIRDFQTTDIYVWASDQFGDQVPALLDEIQKFFSDPANIAAIARRNA